MEASPSPSAASQCRSHEFTPKTFSNPVSFKLNDENFAPWRHQALAAIKAHKLQKHLEKDKVPKRFLSAADEEAGTESQEFSEWEQQDHHLVACLLSSMNEAVTNRVVGCEFAYQVWGKLDTYFASRTKAKIKQLKTQLKSIKKEGSSIADYVLKIKKVVDSLDAVGAPVSIEEHIEVILDGLPEGCCHLITTVLSRTVPYSVDELEALLMAHEERLGKYKKNDVALVQANLAHYSE